MSIKMVIIFTQMYVKVSKHALQLLLGDETGDRRRTNTYFLHSRFICKSNAVDKDRLLEIPQLADLSGSGAAAE